MSEARISAFLQSIGHKFSVESGASQHAEKAFTAVTYPHDSVSIPGPGNSPIESSSLPGTQTQQPLSRLCSNTSAPSLENMS